MHPITLDVSEFVMIVATRAALACGVGLLLGAGLPPEKRRTVGAGLIAMGAITTIPAAMAVARGLRRSRRQRRPSGVQFDQKLIGATRFPRKGDDDRS